MIGVLVACPGYGRREGRIRRCRYGVCVSASSKRFGYVIYSCRERVLTAAATGEWAAVLVVLDGAYEAVAGVGPGG